MKLLARRSLKALISKMLLTVYLCETKWEKAFEEFIKPPIRILGILANKQALRSSLITKILEDSSLIFSKNLNKKVHI